MTVGVLRGSALHFLRKRARSGVLCSILGGAARVRERVSWPRNHQGLELEVITRPVYSCFFRPVVRSVLLSFTPKRTVQRNTLKEVLQEMLYIVFVFIFREIHRCFIGVYITWPEIVEIRYMPFFFFAVSLNSVFFRATTGLYFTFQCFLFNQRS